MKFVLALLGSALAGECAWDDTDEIYVDADDCTLPSCDGDLETPHKGCEPEDCTGKDEPYEGCADIDCTTGPKVPYDGCNQLACEEDDEDATKYDKEEPYDGCEIPACVADDTHTNCVEAETVYCAFDTEAGAPAFVKDDPAGCVDPCDADRDADDLPAECAGGSSTGLIIVLVLAAVGGLAGAFYCKHQKKACFKEKPEGGKFESLI